MSLRLRDTDPICAFRFSVSRFSAAMVLAIDLLSERPEDVQEKRDLLEVASLRLDLMADISVRLFTSSNSYAVSSYLSYTACSQSRSAVPPAFARQG